MSWKTWAVGLGILGVAGVLGYVAVNNWTQKQATTTTSSCPVNLWGLCLGGTSTTSSNNPANPGNNSTTGQSGSPVTNGGGGSVSGGTTTMPSNPSSPVISVDCATLNPLLWWATPGCWATSAATLGW